MVQGKQGTRGRGRKQGVACRNGARHATFSPDNVDQRSATWRGCLRFSSKPQAWPWAPANYFSDKYCIRFLCRSDYRHPRWQTCTLRKQCAMVGGRQRATGASVCLEYIALPLLPHHAHNTAAVRTRTTGICSRSSHSAERRELARRYRRGTSCKPGWLSIRGCNEAESAQSQSSSTINSIPFRTNSMVILQVNSLVYARVSLAHRDMEPELECFNAQTHKAEGFGELKDGFLVRCSLKMSRQCVTSNLPTLSSVHKHCIGCLTQNTSSCRC